MASRPLGSSKFTKFNGAMQVYAPLSKHARIRLETAAQYSTRPLLVPEEFALGGNRIGRAFDFNELSGDHGFGTMFELSYRLDDVKPLPTNLEVFAFVDGGGAFRGHASAGLPKEQWLSSAGAGVRGSILGFRWSGELGIPLARSGGAGSIRAFFSTTKVF